MLLRNALFLTQPQYVSLELCPACNYSQIHSWSAERGAWSRVVSVPYGLLAPTCHAVLLRRLTVTMQTPDALSLEWGSLPGESQDGDQYSALPSPSTWRICL